MLKYLFTTDPPPFQNGLDLFAMSENMALLATYLLVYETCIFAIVDNFSYFRFPLCKEIMIMKICLKNPVIGNLIL